MEKKICPSCGSSDTYYFYSINDVPIYSTTILNNIKEALAFPKGNIIMCFCNECGFIFNGEFNADLLDYSIPYEDQQGFSGTFSKYLQELAEYLDGANVNLRRDDGSTPLHLAAWCSLKAVRFLIESGADINASREDGKTPLDYAYDRHIRDFLIKHGAKSGKELQ